MFGCFVFVDSVVFTPEQRDVILVLVGSVSMYSRAPRLKCPIDACPYLLGAIRNDADRQGTDLKGEGVIHFDTPSPATPQLPQQADLAPPMRTILWGLIRGGWLLAEAFHRRLGRDGECEWARAEMDFDGPGQSEGRRLAVGWRCDGGLRCQRE